MKGPALDHRTTNELLAEIGKKAKAYTPEWHYDPQNPDVGAAVAMIYAELFAQTLKRFNRLPEKNQTAFFDSIGVRLSPSIPAEGFVCFGLSGRPAEGEQVPSGTALQADADNEAGSTIFETVDDVYVTSAALQCIYTVCGEKDIIVKSYGGEKTAPFHLFGLNEQNLQSHSLMFSNERALYLGEGATLSVELTPAHRNTLSPALCKALCDSEQVVWEYTYGDTWQPFRFVEGEGNVIRLTLGERSLPITPQGEQGRRWLRVRLREGASLAELSLQKIGLRCKNQNLRPDCIFAAGTEQNIHDFLPFGEQLGLFAEVYFACEQALVKTGAQIDLHYHLSYLSVPIELADENNQIDWKLIMRRQDFKVDREYDISVAEVIWEYFNGSGWARLFPDGYGRSCFTPNEQAEAEKQHLRFACPPDMSPVLVGAHTGCYIRARVLKINNLYKRKGNYIIPRIEQLRFDYCDEAGARLPEQLIAQNNLRERIIPSTFFRTGEGTFSPFAYLPEKKPCLYYGFDRALNGGPVKLLFLLGEVAQEKNNRLRYEYYSAQGWQRLNAIDQTESLAQSGILTLLAADDFEKTVLWGEDCYWIRAVDEQNDYGAGDRPLPYVTGFYMNATAVRNVNTRPSEQFYIEPEQKNMRCRLSADGVNQAEVWVNEIETLLPKQIEQLSQSDCFLPVRDPTGRMIEAWVRWQEQADFALSGAEDRHYMLDKNEGILYFSDGINGRIPPSGKQPTIEVRYRTGGGQQGNVPARAINRAVQSLGFVSQIQNPRRMTGGCDRETLEKALLRSSAVLCHGGRAVTARDFEALALEACRNIARAQCFSGRNEKGQAEPGSVTLCVVPEDYRAEGELISTVCRQVTQYIVEKCSGNMVALDKFHTIGPQFLELCVKAELVVSDFNQVFSVREAANRKLTQFLDPLTGNFDGKGWRVGEVPNQTQIQNCLSGISGKIIVRSVFCAVFQQTGLGRSEIRIENMPNRIYALPISGAHTIMITVE